MSTHLERRTLLGAAGIGALAAMSKAGGGGGGGPLNPPPGAIEPTGRTLDEVYNRIPVPPAVGAYDGRIPIPGGVAPVTISAPGSYVLTGPLTVSTPGPALRITTGNVSLDLNGQTVTNNSDNLGVYLTEFVRNVTVRNGQISGCAYGAYVSDFCLSVLLEDLMSFSPKRSGMFISGKSVRMRRCTVNDIGGGLAPDGFARTGVLCVGNMCTIEECVFSKFNTAAPVPANLLSGVSVQGAANLVERCVVSNETAIAGSGVHMTGSGTFRHNCVMNLSTPYNTAGMVNGGGNV
ncbi:MAG TPA: hypothetical protein VFF65_01495 [Phycisphaerales bacterium]|nr:hypothetical protein [Phycisphaerales bacterium]